MDEKNLTRRMPDYYQKSRLVQAIHRADAQELFRLEDRFDSVARQFFVSTADSALDRWEDELGLAADKRGEINARRSRILAKLRGRGTTTLAMVRGVAQEFSGGTVEVTEQPPEYWVTFYFSGTRGEPPSAAYLRQSIRELMPAHLDFSFRYRYNTWGEIWALTWGAAERYSWEELEVTAL